MVSKTMDYQHQISDAATKINDFLTDFKGDLKELIHEEIEKHNPFNSKDGDESGERNDVFYHVPSYEGGRDLLYV